MNKLTREIKLNCETLVNVTLERKEWKTHSGRKTVDIRVSAVMPNGFDLANIHHGLIKRHFDGNPRLRTEASKNREITTLMDGIESHLKSIKGAVLDIGDSLDIQVNLTSKDAYIRGIEGVFSLSPNNIKSKTSGVSISWYHHDVYNTGDISVTVTRIESGQLEFTASDGDLYDQTKINQLVESENFKNKKLAFFFYEEAKRLAGLKHGQVESMSGLFA